MEQKKRRVAILKGYYGGHDYDDWIASGVEWFDVTEGDFNALELWSATKGYRLIEPLPITPDTLTEARKLWADAEKQRKRLEAEADKRRKANAAANEAKRLKAEAKKLEDLEALAAKQGLKLVPKT